ncbi:MAG: GTP-binding protein [Anaerolineae bacterium]
MFINRRKREINLNLVYYGPALSGKTTNLQQIHAHLDSGARSELYTLNTREDRTIFFDFMQLGFGDIGGLQPKFGLYTVPGQVYYAATREAVLRRADGVVFVADSQTHRLDDNRASWQDMRAQLRARGVPELPVVVQYNKRDLPNILPVERLSEALDATGLPTFEAVALHGRGVRETLGMALQLVLADVRRKLRFYSESKRQ